MSFLLKSDLGFISLSVFFIRWPWWDCNFSPWHSWKTGRVRGRLNEQWCSVQCFWILKPRKEKVLLHISYLTSPSTSFPDPCFPGRALPLNKTSDRKSLCWQQWSLHSCSPIWQSGMHLAQRYHQMLSSAGRRWNGSWVCHSCAKELC